jgi:hypothetical protein
LRLGTEGVLACGGEDAGEVVAAGTVRFGRASGPVEAVVAAEAGGAVPAGVADGDGAAGVAGVDVAAGAVL